GGRAAGVRPPPAPGCRGRGFSRELFPLESGRPKLAAEAAPTSLWSSVWSGAFVVAVEGVVRTLAGCAFVLRQQFLQFAEQFAERARRLVAPALLMRVADQLAQLLAVGARVRGQQCGQRVVGFVAEQGIAQRLDPVQRGGFALRRLAVLAHGV